MSTLYLQPLTFRLKRPSALNRSRGASLNAHKPRRGWKRNARARPTTCTHNSRNIARINRATGKSPRPFADTVYKGMDLIQRAAVAIINNTAIGNHHVSLGHFHRYFSSLTGYSKRAVENRTRLRLRYYHADIEMLLGKQSASEITVLVI